MDQTKIGRFIAECRKANGFTQLQLADHLGITDKAVSKWERDISCPDINTFPKLAEILGVSVDELSEEMLDKMIAMHKIIEKAFFIN